MLDAYLIALEFVQGIAPDFDRAFALKAKDSLVAARDSYWSHIEVHGCRKTGDQTEVETLLLDRVQKAETQYKENRGPETSAAYKRALRALSGFLLKNQMPAD